MTRAFLVVLDSVGVGGAPDAAEFFNGAVPDTGANTLAHIAQACARGDAEDGRSGPLCVSNLDALGLGSAVRLASGAETPGLTADAVGLWGAATEQSPGKDTPSGHWELAGVPVPWHWHAFPDETPAFPADLVSEVCTRAGTDGILGNRHASGTVVIEEEGRRHIETGWPICYTSADSVFQIAAHEQAFGLDRLMRLCEDLSPTLHAMKVGRVIARPFVGKPGHFERTGNRRDFAISPPAATLCDKVQEAGRTVHAIGKIGDIFSMRGIDAVVKGPDRDLMLHLKSAAQTAPAGSLIFANFVEFDSIYGHRRDVSGYARALEWFDAEIPAFHAALGPGDLVIYTADHGNDPTWVGTDHTRERVPVLGYGAGPKSVGHVSFVDVAASLAAHLGVPNPGQGQSFI
ncbi:MAG: phosphopentomutase [Pseudomonadota bacterium]